MISRVALVWVLLPCLVYGFQQPGLAVRNPRVLRTDLHLNLLPDNEKVEESDIKDNLPWAILPLIAFVPEPAMATAGPIPSALFAWAHFVGLAGIAGGLVAERLIIRPGISFEEEKKLNVADGVYGLAALLIFVSGYFRVTQFAKGWEYYQHEPIFWLKMSGAAVLGGLSLFPTIIFFRRDQARKDGKVLEPLSDALVERITRLINAEILALLSIPLLASLMARGVGYMNEFPWPLGAALYVLALGGSGYKYGKEAFDMMESEGALNEASDQGE